MQQRTDLAGDCETWPLGTNDAGYAQMRDKGKTVYVHRWRFERVNGPIPEGMQVDHLCRNRSCVNVDHLELVTPAENTRRGKNAKVTPAEVDRIRELARTHSYRYIADRFGIHNSQVCRIVNYRYWGEPGQHSRRKRVA